MVKKQQAPSDQKPQMALSEIVSTDFLTLYGKKIGTAVLVLAVIVSGSLYFLKSSKQEKIEDTKSLGLSMKYLTNNALDSAEMALKEFFAVEHDDVSTAKGHLLLGKVYYNQQKYAEALESYRKINLSESDYSLITSGALHGIASCYIQQQQYDKAVEALNKFLATYQKKNADNIHEEDVQDLSPAVPNVLWKLALCFKQLGQPEKLKQACESLIKIYAQSEESAKAEKLLLLL